MADDFTRRRFAWLDQVAADSKVSPAGFVLAYRIAKFFNRDTGEAWPAQPTLAAAMRMDSGPSQWHVGMPKKCPKCSYLKAPKLLICPDQVEVSGAAFVPVCVKVHGSPPAFNGPG